MKNSIVKLYHHQDRLGVTDYLTDNIVGKVTSYVTYDGFGALTAKAVLKISVRELDLVQDYTGHPADMALGVYYAKARMYDANNRRFMAIDPIKDGLNWYAYCGNNPVLYFDPTGLAYVVEHFTVDKDISWVWGESLLSSGVHIKYKYIGTGTYELIPTTKVEAFFKDINLATSGTLPQQASEKSRYVVGGMSQTQGHAVSGVISLGSNFIPAYKIADDLGNTIFKLVMYKTGADVTKDTYTVLSLGGNFAENKTQLQIAKYDNWMFRFFEATGMSTKSTDKTYLGDLELRMNVLINNNKDYFETVNCLKSQFDIAYDVALAINRGVTLDAAITQAVNGWIASYNSNTARLYISMPSRTELEEIAREAYNTLTKLPDDLADIQIVTVSEKK